MKKINLTLAVVVLTAIASTFTACGGDSFTDPRDGQEYKTVKIGDQVWMAENLKYKGGAESVRETGAYYTWDSALVACPDGWHLPSKSELESVVADTTFDRIWSSTEKEDFSLGAYAKIGEELTLVSKTDDWPMVRCVQGKGEKQQRLQEINGYKAERIGKQIWMSKNLDVESPNSICYLEDDEECSKGRFYSISEAQNICPEGWRLPNKKDATALINKLSKYCKERYCKNEQFASLKYCSYIPKFWGQKMGYYDDKAQFHNGTGVMIIGYWLLADSGYIKNHFDLEIESFYSFMRNAKFNVRCIADTEDNKEE